MATLTDRARASAPGRFHSFLLAAATTLFLGALLADYAYWTSHQVEWSNFASWLLVGALVAGAVALLLAVVALVRGRHALLGFLLQLAMWIVGFVDVLVHARDAWAVMPTGLLLSAIAALLAAVATWLAFSTLRVGGRP